MFFCVITFINLEEKIDCTATRTEELQHHI